MTKYLRIPADGTKDMEEVDLKGLDALQAGIGGGWIEGVNLPPRGPCPGARLYCDEEYVYKPSLQVNVRASLLAHTAGIFARDDEAIAGDVLLFKGYDANGDDVGVDEDVTIWATAVHNMLKSAGVI